MRNLYLVRPMFSVCLALALFSQCSTAKRRSDETVGPAPAPEVDTPPAVIPKNGSVPPVTAPPGSNRLQDAATGVGPGPMEPTPPPFTNVPPDARPGTPVKPVADASVTGPAPDAFFGGSRCPKDTMNLCEDFESGKIDSTVWSLGQSKAAATIESARAARGKNALHVTVSEPMVDGYHLGFITTKRAFPVAGANLFVRAFVYIDAISTHRHFTVFSATGNSKYAIDVIPAWNPPYLPANYRMLWYPPGKLGGEPTGDTYGKPWTQTPLGRWACWEWEMHGATNETRFSIDDKEIVPLRIDAQMGWTAPTTAKLGFGMEQFHAVREGFSLWIDEIAVSTEKIGCAM